LIEKPLRNKFTFTNDQVWQILVWVEMQGGRKEFAKKINDLIEQIVQEHER
jgi:hypothetical protein